MLKKFDGRGYEKFVETVAQYPHSGEQTIGSLLYPIFGLTGEFAEVVEKLQDDSRAVHYDIVKELGDVFWYFTRVANELGRTLNELMADSLHYTPTRYLTTDKIIVNYIINCGRVAELSKKAIRDDGGDLNTVISVERNGEIFKNLAKAFSYFNEIILDCDSDLEEVAMVNVDKLTSRVKRGVLNGDGDDR